MRCKTHLVKLFGDPTSRIKTLYSTLLLFLNLFIQINPQTTTRSKRNTKTVRYGYRGGTYIFKTQVIGKVASQLGNNVKQPGGSPAECERVGCCRVATYRCLARTSVVPALHMIP